MFRGKVFTPALVLAAGLAASACGDQDTPVTPEPGARAQAAAAQQPNAPGLDGRFLQLTRQVPGFGGYYFDAQGDLNVYLTDLRQEAAARAAVADVARNRPQPAAHPFSRPAAIIIRQGQYDFPQLDAWRGSLRAAFSIAGIQFLDVDETANRVRVGVSSADAAAQVRSLAGRLGVASGALVVDVVPAGEPILTVRDYIRPTEGGLEIVRSDGAQCTLGLNIWYANPNVGIPAGTAGFLTASHCSTTSGANDGTVFSQGGVRIGTERWDPPFFDNTQNTRCPLNRHCRWSDVSFFTYDAGVSWQLGAIARTDFYGLGPWNAGSLDINSSTPRWALNSGVTPVVGQYLDKVGRTTGWTSGSVARTCADYPQLGDHVILCQDEVNAYADNGDSGSPVFQWGYTSNVSAAGIVWYKTGTGTYVLSNTSQIGSDFGIAITWF